MYLTFLVGAGDPPHTHRGSQDCGSEIQAVGSGSGVGRGVRSVLVRWVVGR